MKLKNIHLLLLLATCWGPSFLFIKIAVHELSPFMVTALRIGIAALVLNGILLLQRSKLPTGIDFWKKTLIAGFFAQALPFTLINWGEQYVDSSLASLLNGLVPICTIVLAQLMLNERMTENKVRGVVLGLVGLVILVAPSLLGGASGTLIGIGSITLASVSYGLGLVYIRKNLVNIPSFHAPAAQLLVTSAYMLPLAFVESPDFSFAAMSSQTLWSMIILGVFGTAVAFVLYFKLLERADAAYVSMVTYLMPIYGVVLGIIVLNEALTAWMVLGSGSILLGISFVNSNGASPLRRFGRSLDRQLYSRFR